MPEVQSQIHNAGSSSQPVTISSVREYLEMVASVSNKGPTLNGYHSFAEFLLKHGLRFNVSPDRAGLPAWVKPMVPKECFSNAAKLAIRHPDKLAYVEGYAAGIIPLSHAWCVDRDGEVVDPTWGHNEVRAGTDYFGVAVSTEFLTKLLLENKYYGLIEVYRGKSLLEFSPEEWEHEWFN